jgi:hypothetical protein
MHVASLLACSGITTGISTGAGGDRHHEYQRLAGRAHVSKRGDEGQW